MPAPTRPAAPPQALRSNPDTFSVNAELSIQYQWGALPTWIEAMGDYIQDQADAATAAALTGDVAPNPGVALSLLRVNAAGSGLEYRTPAQVRSDIGATTVGAAVLTAANEAAARTAIGATVTGANVFTAATALAARTAIGSPAQPQTSAGVGQIGQLFAPTNTAITLPAGGTWFYFAFLQDNTSGVVVAGGLGCGIAAGGASVLGPVSNASGYGFAWRLA